MRSKVLVLDFSLGKVLWGLSAVARRKFPFCEQEKQHETKIVWLFCSGLKLCSQHGCFCKEPQGKQACLMQVRVMLFSGKYLILWNHQLLLPVSVCLWDGVTSPLTAQNESSQPAQLSVELGIE